MFSCKVSEQIELRLLERRHRDELFRLIDFNREYWRPWTPGFRPLCDRLRMPKISLRGGFNSLQTTWGSASAFGSREYCEE